jgi:hypothetical protein
VIGPDSVCWHPGAAPGHHHNRSTTPKLVEGASISTQGAKETVDVKQWAAKENESWAKEEGPGMACSHDRRRRAAGM